MTWTKGKHCMHYRPMQNRRGCWYTATIIENANELSSTAARDAQYVMGYLVGRAMTASKTGDQPYRHLLDMFAEDFILVLSNAEWPKPQNYSSMY